MAGINKIKQFCTTGAVSSDADYETLRPSGNIKGRASSAFVNKALKQSSYVAAGLAEAVAEVYGNGVDETAPLTGMVDGIKELLASYATPDEVPAGAITMFSGTQAALDAFYVSNGVRWFLCNGQNGTPDLRDRFIVCSGGSYAIGATGGSNSVTLTEAQMPSHAHQDPTWNGLAGQYEVPNDQNAGTYGFDFGAQSAPTGATGGSQQHENRPPYYALAFIMKGA